MPYNLTDIYNRLQELNTHKQEPDLASIKDVSMLQKTLYALNPGIYVGDVVMQLRDLLKDLRSDKPW